ncbi:MAG: M14/M99 family metallopeptidase [Thermodesulfobacteriota bacterium]|nr:M14/M99 family metallopeptidase [Thermodesulfobacteriota bacterium]
MVFSASPGVKQWRTSRFFRRAGAWTALCLACLLLLPVSALSQRAEHVVYFENTDYELHVYRLYGREDGKTLLLIGGIQGDEPGGFLSADLYVDLTLARGNLIVVPRANFQSILMQRRQVNKDMNRTFSGDVDRNSYEARVVEILKELIAESDCMLNLHDGSGFYSPTWISDQRNPNRYGQCLIADCDIYEDPERGIRLELEKMARTVIAEMNRHIKNPDHHFRFNNHRTNEKDSSHKEQRGSATYYAVYNCGIPAFGVETHKGLSLAEKVSQHNYAINGFMALLDIVPETPGIYLDTPELSYLLVSINGGPSVLVANQQTLYVRPGDIVRVIHIEANYKRGLTVDLLGAGTLNDLRKDFKITRESKLVARKDSLPCGTVYVAFGGDPMNRAQNIATVDTGGSALFFNVEVNGQPLVFPNYGTVELIRGDTFKLVDVAGNGPYEDLVVNFKGFVGDQANNTGEDRGFLIRTAVDLWERYAIDREKAKYQVVATRNNEVAGKLFVHLNPPVMRYLMLQVPEGIGGLYCCKPGQTLVLHPGMADTLRLADMITNVADNAGVKVFSGFGDTLDEWSRGSGLPGADRVAGRPAGQTCRVEVRRGDEMMGQVTLRFLKEPENG